MGIRVQANESSTASREKHDVPKRSENRPAGPVLRRTHTLSSMYYDDKGLMINESAMMWALRQRFMFPASRSLVSRTTARTSSSMQANY